MKTIEVDEELYRYIASHTMHIGESASDILRRMLNFKSAQQPVPAKEINLEASAPQAAPVLNPKIVEQNPVRVIRELLLSDAYAEKNKAIDRFMLILSTLYSLDAKSFESATESMHGRTRVYFAGDEQTLLAAGKQSKPRHIPGTPYWVITNTNTNRKRSMVDAIMQEMKFPANVIEKVSNTI
ncbi:Negative modulator of initiation of replication [Providencia rustigianii]|uniref:Negative modulator of initiation of replication n=2 Tax=Providencia rustigianii TaxID=158850 RepID=D1P018_9GAMM|nr:MULTISPECIES: replication initiation negative regulator SeqA [Providencia]EFB73434.1 SeqA protein [Providencia rustigianii DSM 4541]MTC58204.1 replication initiation negative regulator SeqA [Providencia rustigianii]MTC61652.1 replication initiation negative regulator SeqA [Providencia rustigianii]SPY77060.1 Negative modulator of initiation of replication [Providencia rustigianii]SUC26372.1 Negative modulator of initiation of replication [Providencia rustigianii]